MMEIVERFHNALSPELLADSSSHVAKRLALEEIQDEARILTPVPGRVGGRHNQAPWHTSHPYAALFSLATLFLDSINLNVTGDG